MKSEAVKLLRFSEAMIEKVRAEATGEPLRLAYAPSLAGEFIAIAIERFSQLHPRVRISLSDRSSAEMHTGLAAGKFD
ncbi:MAG: LysR substrate-binding domain-containing protein, partial [Verrucomicrobiales bacterium]